MHCVQSEASFKKSVVCALLLEFGVRSEDNFYKFCTQCLLPDVGIRSEANLFIHYSVYYFLRLGFGVMLNSVLGVLLLEVGGFGVTLTFKFSTQCTASKAGWFGMRISFKFSTQCTVYWGLLFGMRLTFKFNTQGIGVLALEWCKFANWLHNVLLLEFGGSEGS